MVASQQFFTPDDTLVRQRNAGLQNDVLLAVYRRVFAPLPLMWGFYHQQTYTYAFNIRETHLSLSSLSSCR